MKERKNIGDKILVIVILLLAFLLYPWFVKTNSNGETICSNILGYSYNCD